MKTFRIKVRAYGYLADFTVKASEEGKPLEDSIIDKLGKGDIKWEYLGEMYDPRRQRITYEEVINGGDDATSTKSIPREKGSRSEMGTGAS